MFLSAMAQHRVTRIRAAFGICRGRQGDRERSEEGFHYGPGLVAIEGWGRLGQTSHETRQNLRAWRIDETVVQAFDPRRRDIHHVPRNEQAEAVHGRQRQANRPPQVDDAQNALGPLDGEIEPDQDVVDTVGFDPLLCSVIGEGAPGFRRTRRTLSGRYRRCR